MFTPVRRSLVFVFSGLFCLLSLAAAHTRFYRYPLLRSIGDPVDSLNGVRVYYNGPVSNVSGRNTTADGYNLGLKYQCVEFVKRYYYQHYKHKMPDSYGHAKSFYNKSLSDGSYNKARNLTQYANPSATAPRTGDLLVYDGNSWNPYGHVAIVSAVSTDKVEIIQQNPGPAASSRETFTLTHKNGSYKIEGSGILGWLRKK